MSSRALVSRLRRDLDGVLPPELVAWCALAAQALEQQLFDCGGVAHRELVDPIAAWLDFEPGERAALGAALDLLQVAFDLSDNLADAEEDARAGRRYQQAYEGIPHAVRYCLPAHLVATSHELLSSAFRHRPQALADTSRFIHDTLGTLVRGQGCEDKAEKARLVSGAQARLLCLPLWLRPEHPVLTSSVRARVLLWAETWGTSWELGFEYQERPSAQARALWVRAVNRARAVWPDFGPFRRGGPLSPDLHLVAVC